MAGKGKTHIGGKGGRRGVKEEERRSYFQRSFPSLFGAVCCDPHRGREGREGERERERERRGERKGAALVTLRKKKNKKRKILRRRRRGGAGRIPK